jgi:uncharacterized protein (UPF0261 family)
MTVVLVGTLDTRGPEIALVRDRLRSAGMEVMVIDAGAQGQPAFAADVAREEVFRAAGTSLAAIRDLGDRSRAVARAGEGAALILAGLARDGRVAGAMGLGGGAGAAIAATALRALPFGMPKVLVAGTSAGRSSRSLTAGTDLLLVPALADLDARGRVSRTILHAAADALAGMVRGAAAAGDQAEDAGRSLIAASVAGPDDPAARAARPALEQAGHEVALFPADGAGGRALERLVRDGRVAAVLDLATAELADELLGGLASAGPSRLEAAVAAGIPQVVSLIGLDAARFEAVPPRLADRAGLRTAQGLTLVRTSPEEAAELGHRIARIIARATVPTVVLVPTGGLSTFSLPGRPLNDPSADIALFDALQEGLARHPRVRLVMRAEASVEPSFAVAAAGELLSLIDAGG